MFYSLKYNYSTVKTFEMPDTCINIEHCPPEKLKLKRTFLNYDHQILRKYD